MSKYSIILIILAILLIITPTWSQEKSEQKIELSKKKFGINIGTGFFQHINLDLLNFKQEILTTSDNLIPKNFKANFSYHFTPKLAIRFSSGYGFSRQKIQNEVDYGKINLMDIKLIDKSTFSVTGFPAEVALIFQTPVDVRASMFLHFGIGLGYYVYNYKAEGIFKEVSSKTNIQENYRNPEMTLSGIAQSFMLGFNINISSHIGTMLEVSKLGWSSMKLSRDIVKQENEAGDIINEEKYGYQLKDYAIINGIDDLAVSFGIYWNL